MRLTERPVHTWKCSAHRALRVGEFNRKLGALDEKRSALTNDLAALHKKRDAARMAIIHTPQCNARMVHRTRGDNRMLSYAAGQGREA